MMLASNSLLLVLVLILISFLFLCTNRKMCSFEHGMTSVYFSSLSTGRCAWLSMGWHLFLIPVHRKMCSVEHGWWWWHLCAARILWRWSRCLSSSQPVCHPLFASVSHPRFWPRLPSRPAESVCWCEASLERVQRQEPAVGKEGAGAGDDKERWQLYWCMCVCVCVCACVCVLSLIHISEPTRR